MLNKLNKTERALQVDVGFIGAIRAAARERACAVCGALFIPRPAQVAAGRGVYCSQACHGKVAPQHLAVMGWHGQKRAWAVRKMTELDALAVTVERLMKGDV